MSRALNEAGWNTFDSIDDLPVDQDTKEMVLEYLARRYWKVLLDLKYQDGHSKTYDPLIIDGNTAHSYVFDLEDGGRHHSFDSLKDLERMMTEEFKSYFKEDVADAF